jgi:hypothetical protein
MTPDLRKLTKTELIEMIERKDEAFRISQEMRSHRAHSSIKGDQLTWRLNTLQGAASGVQFDEIVVGDWLHIEMMDGGPKRASFFAMVGDMAFWFRVTPKKVTVTSYEKRGPHVAYPVSLSWEGMSTW